MIIALIGPCGCGKTTVGLALARKLGWNFIDADDYHSEENRNKMAKSIPLDDNDRMPWLISLHKRMSMEANSVLACSALKRAYRQVLIDGADPTGDHEHDILFVLLSADENILEQRLRHRKGHFMPVTLIASQLATLEPPDNTEKNMVLDATESCETLVEKILKKIDFF
ncbi:putative gluconokinase [Clonorchis sinensis]|uniref:Gluconokinase n=2 Tax=Clonorchis sinensis TaxID=79923 RepID=A0A8T1M9U5_CLOSI|nr:putative gluconokinase [Clonorchis sinensis]GAA42540.2 gluconokinase [Clonorchis sinensis]